MFYKKIRHVIASYVLVLYQEIKSIILYQLHFSINIFYKMLSVVIPTQYPHHNKTHMLFAIVSLLKYNYLIFLLLRQDAHIYDNASINMSS